VVDNDIAYDIAMLTADQIREVRQQVEALRRRAGSVHHREVEPILDRVCNRRAAGREPYAWTSKVGRRGFPITVPRHPKPLAPGTLRNILDDIEAELNTMEELLDQQG